MWVKRVGRIRLPPLGTKAAWRGNRCRQGTACTLRLAGRWWSRAHSGAKCGWWEQRREEVKPCQDTNTQVDTELYGWGGVERLEEIIQRQRVQGRATTGLWNSYVTVVNLKIERIRHFERHFVWDASSDIFTLGTREQLPSTLDPKVDWLVWTQPFRARAPCLVPLGKMVSGHGPCMPEHARTRKWAAACDVRPSRLDQKQTWLHTADVEVGSRWDGCWKGIVLKCCIVHGCVLQRYRDTAVDISKFFVCVCLQLANQTQSTYCIGLKTYTSLLGHNTKWLTWTVQNKMWKQP